MIGFFKKNRILVLSVLLSGFLLLDLDVKIATEASAVVTKTTEENVQKTVSSLMKKIYDMGIKTNLYSRNLTDEVLLKRFENMQKDRWSVYFVNSEDYKKEGALGEYKDEFKTPENFSIWKSRYPFPMAFSYNLIDENYNASIIKTSFMTFFVFEAPSDKNKIPFLNIILENNLKCFVKLNSSEEYPFENYFSYWKERDFPQLFELFWIHRESEEVESLLEFVNKVRSFTSVNDRVGVSCRAGAGRSGTFIAAFTIVNEIEKQLNSLSRIQDLSLDIDKIVWEISVQRPFAVTHPSQYVSLYRLVDFYIEKMLAR